MTDINNIINSLFDDEEGTIVEIKSLINSNVENLIAAVDEAGEEIDYLVEKFLEFASNDIENFQDCNERVENYWLQIKDVPGGTSFEINVRAAEFLAALNNINKINTRELEIMSKSEDWRVRLVCAWTVREDDSSAVADIKEMLSSDDFQDDNGLYLIREGTGNYDD